jgi:hypothetical protein
MSIIRSTRVALLVLAGLAATTAGAQSFMERLKAVAAAAKASQPAGAGSGVNGGRPLVGSEIDGMFRRHPITNSQKPETWPRVAITITSVAPAAFNNYGVAASTIAANDCATYNIVVWTDDKTSKAHEGLRLCYGEIYAKLQNVAIYQVETWGRRQFWAGQPNSGSVRGTGPLPPTDHFPTDPGVPERWLDRYRNTLPFLAGPLTVLGFNWNDINDKRVWFVSVPGA